MTARRSSSALLIPTTPTDPAHATSKSYVDAAIAGVISGDVTIPNIDGLQDALDSKVDKSLLDAKGDLIVATGDNTPGRLAVGANGTFLKADSTQTVGQIFAALLTSDVTGLDTALAGKAPLASPAFTGTPTGITKAHVGLGNVDNTSNATERAASATLQNKTLDNTTVETIRDTNLTIQRNADVTQMAKFAVHPNGPNATITVTLPPANSVLLSDSGAQTGIANKTFNDDTTKWRDASDNTKQFRFDVPSGQTTATSRVHTLPAVDSTLASLDGTETLTGKTLTAPVINSPTGIVKGDVGLGNVDNTSNATERAAVATLTNKTLTSPVINSPTGIVKADVGLGNVDNTSNATERAAVATLTNKTLTSPVISAGTSTALAINSYGTQVTLYNDGADKTCTFNVNPLTATAQVFDVPPTSTTLVGTTSTQTLTNKRITRRAPVINAPGATPTLAWDSADLIILTGVNAAITSMTSGITGTPTQGQAWTVRLKDDGTPRAITWGASYRVIGVVLPTTTVAGKTIYVGGFYNDTDSVYDVTAVATEA